MSRILFEIVAQDVGVAKQLDEIRERIKQLKKELKGTAEGTAEFDRLQNELVGSKVQLNQLTAEQRALNREFKAAQFPVDSLVGMRLQYAALFEQVSKLSAAQRESDFGKSLIQQAEGLDREIKKVEESVGRFTSSVGNYKKALLSIGDLVTAGLLTGGIDAAIRAVSSAVTAGVDALADYESALDRLSAITGITGEQLDEFRQKAEEITTIKLGDSEIVNTANDIFEAFTLVGSAQPKLLESAAALQQVTKDALILSAASGDGLQPSVEALTTTLGQFQLEASKSTEVANQLAAGARAGASEIPQTTEALQKFGTTAAVSNISTAESIALIQTLAEQQLKGAEAGTQLRNVLVKLAAGDALPRRAVEAFKEAGVDVKVLTDTTLPLETRLTELSKVAGDTSQLVRVFGTENLTAAQILTQNVVRYKEFVTAVSNTNEAYKQAEINTGNLKTELSNLKKVGLNTAVEGFKQLSPAIQFVVDVLAKALGLVGGFLNVLVQLPQFINENKLALAGLATGIALLNANTILATANTLRLAAIQKINAAVTTVVTAAQTALNVAMSANPIGLIVTAISLLVLGFKQAYQSSETFRASINGLGAVASEIFTIIKEAVGSFINGFKQLKEGNFSGALKSFGDAIVKSNPIGLAFTQGKRLKEAFNKGYDETLAAVKTPDTKPAESAVIKLKDTVTAANDDITKTSKGAAKAQKDAAEAAAEATQKQVERIKESLELLRQLQRDAITNDFDRQIADIQEKRLKAIEKVAKQRAELEAKINQQATAGGQPASTPAVTPGAPITAATPGASATDVNEAQLIDQETAAIEAAYQRQFAVIQRSREKARETARAELEKTLLEVQKLAANNAQRLAEIDAQIADAGFRDRTETLRTTFEERKRILTESFADGNISEKEFTQQSVELESQFNKDSAELLRQRVDVVRTYTEQITEIKRASARAQLESEIAAIDAGVEAEKNALLEKAALQGINVDDQIAAVDNRANEQRNAALAAYNKAVLDATEQQKRAQIDALNAVNDADEQVSNDKLERLKKEAETREELQNAAIEAVSTISGAIFDIERNRIEQQKTAAIDALNVEYNKKLEAAKGNKVLEEKLKKELEEKKAAVEKDAAKKRKRLAITEAIINGALAVVKALPNVILAALTAIATAAQIAVISSQQFAAGGFTGAGSSRRDNTGRRVAGVVHENEYVAPTSQIERWPELFRWLEYDRRKNLRPYAAGGFVSDFTPQIAVPGGSGAGQLQVDATAQFDDKQVDALGAALGKSISQTVAAEVRTALGEGLNDANRRLERETLLAEQRTI